MNTTKEERKQKAIEYMKKLGIYKPYISGFEEKNYVCYFEGFGGFWTWQDEKLSAKIKEIEEKYDCTVYAVTHEITEFGEIYDLLVVTDYKEEWDDLLYNNHSYNYAFAYCWNKTDNFCSEFGTIALQSFGGGIRRIG
jgi:hypothetical protein